MEKIMVEKKRIEPWPLAIIIFFAVVFSANAVLIYLAVNSKNGLVTDDYYKKGITYNKVIEAQKVQDALGWTGKAEAGGLAVGEAGTFRFSLTDRDGAPVTGARVEAILFRPTKEGFDQKTALAESAPGTYQGQVRPPLPGRWDLKISAVHPEGGYRYAQRIEVQGSGPAP